MHFLLYLYSVINFSLNRTFPAIPGTGAGCEWPEARWLSSRGIRSSARCRIRSDVDRSSICMTCPKATGSSGGLGCATCRLGSSCILSELDASTLT